MTHAFNRAYLGMPLQTALERLLKLGVTPAVLYSAARGREGSDGELRVVRQNADGSELVCCAFLSSIREGQDERMAES